MFRSLLPRFPRRTPSAVTCNPGFALPRTYALTAAAKERKMVPGLNRRHALNIAEKKFPSDFPGETIVLPITYPVSAGMFASSGPYMTRDDDIQQLHWKKSFSEVHFAVGESFANDIRSSGLPAGIDVHRKKIKALPSATRTVRIVPDPVPEDDWLKCTGEPLLVLAVALSQPRQHLHHAIPKFFESHPSLHKVIAVHIDESPAFTSPLAEYKVDDDHLDPRVRGHCEGFLNPPADLAKDAVHVFDKPLKEVTARVNEDVEQENTDKQYEPLTLYGQEWAGEFTANVQVWHRGETGATPQSEPVAFYGRDAVTSPDLEISTSDLVVKDGESKDGESKAIQFNWEHWRSELDRTRKLLVGRRYMSAVRFMSRIERERKRNEAKGQEQEQEQEQSTQ